MVLSSLPLAVWQRYSLLFFLRTRRVRALTHSFTFSHVVVNVTMPPHLGAISIRGRRGGSIVDELRSAIMDGGCVSLLVSRSSCANGCAHDKDESSPNPSVLP